MTLNDTHEIIFTKRVSTGLVNRIFIHLRETFAEEFSESLVPILVPTPVFRGSEQRKRLIQFLVWK